MIGDTDDQKDRIALGELETIMNRLETLHERAKANIGKLRPIISLQEIEVVKDHLDLVVKYTRL